MSNVPTIIPSTTFLTQYQANKLYVSKGALSNYIQTNSAASLSSLAMTGTLSTSGAIHIQTTSANAFYIYNASGANTALNVNTSTLSVTTNLNTLDDGSGNMAVHGYTLYKGVNIKSMMMVNFGTSTSPYATQSLGSTLLNPLNVVFPNILLNTFNTTVLTYNSSTGYFYIGSGITSFTTLYLRVSYSLSTATAPGSYPISIGGWIFVGGSLLYCGAASSFSNDGIVLPTVCGSDVIAVPCQFTSYYFAIQAHLMDNNNGSTIYIGNSATTGFSTRCTVEFVDIE